MICFSTLITNSQKENRQKTFETIKNIFPEKKLHKKKKSTPVMGATSHFVRSVKMVGLVVNAASHAARTAISQNL